MFIKRFQDFLNEGISFIENPDSLPKFKSFDILSDGQKIGSLDLNFLSPDLNDNELEISLIQIDPEFRGSSFKFGTQTIQSMWKEFPGIDKIFLQSTKEAEGFWKKIGAKESKERENFLEISREEIISHRT